MTKQLLRDTIINLLDDEEGINEAAYQGVNEICCEHNWTDIADAVEGTKGRYFLGEDDVEDLRKVTVVGSVGGIPCTG
jgi:hypothetical protein